MGLPLWERKTQKSEVLYLALEDTERRLQKRLMRICNGETGDISFATEAEILDHGFEEQVIDYLQKHPDAKLVIVDTMIKVRDTGGYGNAYAEDYSTMNCFKRLTTRFSIVLLLVHHTRKQEVTRLTIQTAICNIFIHIRYPPFPLRSPVLIRWPS